MDDPMADNFGHGCPVCGGAQLCPCANCKPLHAEEVMWRWDETGELISCGHCGHTMHADRWQDLDFQRYDNEKRLQACADGDS